MSEFEKRQDECPGSRSGGHFVPPPPSSHGGMYHHPAPHHGGHPHMSSGPHPTASFSPGTSHHHKMKHSMPANGVPPVTPPHMPSQQHHLRQAPSSASSQYMSPQHYGPPPHGYHHPPHGGHHHQQYHHPPGHGPAPGTFMPPYSQHPIQHHEARGHHHRHGPHVSQSGSGSLGEAPPTPKTSKLDVIDEKGPNGSGGEAEAAAAPPSTFADFEPPRDDPASTEGGGNGDKKRQSDAAAAKGSDSLTAPNSPDTKKQRTLAPSASKDAATLSPTLTFASRCDSFRGAIAGTGVGLPTGMSFGMSGQDSQILQSWSAGSLIGRPNSPGDIQVCFDGWNPNSGASASGSGANGGSTRSPPGPQGMSGRSWEEPIPLGSASMMEFDKANAAASGSSTNGTKDQPLKNQGSFGPPPPPLGQGFHRGMGMSGEFHPPGGHYGKPALQQHQQSYPGAPGWSPSFPSPHGHGHSMERRDEMGHLSSPRGGWAQEYAPPRTGSYGYPHHSPHATAYPPMHGVPGPMDDSRRDPSTPYMMGPSHQHHHANFGGNGRFAIHSHAGQLRTPDGVLLLAMPDDRISLSETLCVVRENVEVFCATEADVKAPAPGRKRPVTVGQIGLRCIHCRNATNPGDRVKRAVCFPSSLKRIYRTVIDMKLDHFKACRYVPQELKTKLAELKQTNGRSTGTTMQYFVGAAKKMGMIDGPNGNGVRYDPSLVMTGPPLPPPALIQQDSRSPGQPPRPEYRPRSNTNNTLALTDSHMSFDRQIGMSHSAGGAAGYPPHPYAHHHMPVMHHGVGGAPMFLSGSGSLSMGSFGASDIKKQSSDDYSVDSSAEFFTGQVSLSMPEDKTALSPLRCFLRENVIAFSATKEDIAVRTPTTFAVVEGQVGIGCVHCYKLPAKQRSNRAVCFPFSVGRIYQSVADIQRFHLNECKMVPPEVREKFVAHQKASTKGSKGLATRQYWVSSAKKLGLADTKKGIRFIRDPGAPAEQPASLDVLAQVASDVNTASKPLVFPEDKPTIAEFLYVVMEQLQPCRFTEADRNKRRLKNMGSIGVECKHCAGKIDGRKFFWSSVNAVESNFVSVHTHMMECKFIPQELKDELAELKLLRKEQTSRLKVGSQKAFFNTVWERLHANEEEQKKEAAAAIKEEGDAQKPSANEMTPTTPSPPHDIAAPVDHQANSLAMPDLNNSLTSAPVGHSEKQELMGEAKNVCSI